jgi:hypothetical protein
MLRLLPAAAAEALSSATSRDAVHVALAQAIPDATDRAVLGLRMLGLCDDARDTLMLALSLEILLTQDDQALSGAITPASTTPEGLEGSLKWLMAYAPASVLAEKSPRGYLLETCRRYLASDEPGKRRAAIAALGRLGGVDARTILRPLLAPEWPAPSLSDRFPSADPVQEALGPGGTEFVDLPLRASDQACAALVLARLGDRKSADRIRELAAEAGEWDVAAYEAALAILDGHE